MDSNIAKKYLKLFGVSSIEDFFNIKEINYITNTLMHEIESVTNKYDKWGNWDAQFSKEPYNTPFLDYFILSKIKQNNLTKKELYPNGKKWAFCMTHDVDRVSYYDPVSFIRNIKKRKRKTKSLNKKIILQINQLKTILKSKLINKNTDKLWQFEEMLEFENKNNINPTYFFYILPDDKKDLSIYDCDYSINDKINFKEEKILVKDFIKNISKFAEIGLHSSYNTFDNYNLMQQQKQKLEIIVNKKIYSVRQHYLHYNINKTKVIHEKLFKIDSTLGFNTDIGYRAGTCFPYFLSEDLIEIPMILMDSSLFKITNGDIEKSKMIINNKISEIKKIGGVFTVNFHLDYIAEPFYKELYYFVVERAKNEDAYFANFTTIRKIIKECVE